MFFQAVTWFVASLDQACSAVDGIYRNWPGLLKLQTFLSLHFAVTLLLISKLNDSVQDAIGTGIYVLLWYILAIYFGFVFLSVATLEERRPMEHESRTPAYVRLLLQWVLQSIVKNMAESASHLADWPTTIACFFYSGHVVSFLKLHGRFNDFGAIDATFTISVAFADAMLQNPWLKIASTVIFAVLMGMREHRAKK